MNMAKVVDTATYIENYRQKRALPLKNGTIPKAFRYFIFHCFLFSREKNGGKGFPAKLNFSYSINKRQNYPPDVCHKSLFIARPTEQWTALDNTFEFMYILTLCLYIYTKIYNQSEMKYEGHIAQKIQRKKTTLLLQRFQAYISV